MLDPHDDTDVPSGSTDGAQMESTSSPVPRLHGDHRQEDEGSPVPTSSSSAPCPSIICASKAFSYSMVFAALAFVHFVTISRAMRSATERPSPPRGEACFDGIAVGTN